MSRFDKRNPQTGRAGEALPPPQGDPFATGYPTIWEYLTIRMYESGEERKTSTLLAFVEDGVWKACLNDRDQQRSLWVTGGSHAGALAALEALLEAGGGVWRQYTPYDGRAKKRS